MSNKDELMKFDTDRSSWINDIDARYKKNNEKENQQNQNIQQKQTDFPKFWKCSYASASIFNTDLKKV